MNVLVVGTGSIARRHIKNLQELDEIKRIYIYSSRGIPPSGISDNKVFTQESLQNLQDVDFAIIANETHKHISVATKLAEQGIHLFLEKPVSHKLQEAQELKELTSEKSILVFVGYNLRFLGIIQFLKKEIEKGRFGKIFFAQIEAGQFLPDWRPGRDYRKVYSAFKNQGGGVALELSHELDYMMYLFGFPSQWNFFSKKVSNLEIETDDIFEGIFCFQKDFVCNVHLDYLQQTKKRSLKIVGSEGTADCNLLNKNLTLSRTDPDSGKLLISTIDDESLFDLDATYKDELKSFINTINRGSKPEISLHDGLQVLDLLKGQNV
jgi:predicted dehydrogenase